MSTEGPAASADAEPGPPDDRQALEEEIEQTREYLGETVQALAGKADVKARAQDKASELTGHRAIAGGLPPDREPFAELRDDRKLRRKNRHRRDS
jgi:Protein of unknown function (DUF3618)